MKLITIIIITIMFGAICLHWSLKSPNSQHVYAKVLVIKTEFTYSSIALQPVRFNNSRNGRTVLYITEDYALNAIWRQIGK